MKKKFLREVLGDVLLFSLFAAVLIFCVGFVISVVGVFFNRISGGKMLWSEVMETWLTISLVLSFAFFVRSIFRYLWPTKKHFRKWLQKEVSTRSNIIDCHQKSLIFKEAYEKLARSFGDQHWLSIVSKFLNVSDCFLDKGTITAKLEEQNLQPVLVVELIELIGLYRERVKAEFKKNSYNDSDEYNWLLPSLLVSKDHFVLEIKKHSEYIALCQSELEKL